MGIRRGVVLVAMLALLTAALWMVAASAHALVVPLSTKQLCDYSQTIVVATVDSQEAAWTGTPGAPESETGAITTEVHLRVLEVLKGSPGAELTIQTPGGRVGSTTVTFEDAPAFAVGSSYVVFLDSERRIVGWREGNLKVLDGHVSEAGEPLRAFERRVARITGTVPVVRRAKALVDLRSPRTHAGPRTHEATRHELLGIGKWVAPPRITAIRPGSASAGTGTPVTIKGSGFGTRTGLVQFLYKYEPGKTLRIDVPRSEIVSWSDTRVVCWVPVGTIKNYPASAGSGPVRLRTAGKKWSNDWSGFKVSFGYLRFKLAYTACPFRVNASGSFTWARGSITAAAQTWSDAGADFAFKDFGDCTTTTYQFDGDNDIFFSTSQLPSGVTSTLAQTTFEDEGKSLYNEFDIVLNADPSITWGGGFGNSHDVQSVVLHELGHAVGLRDLYGVPDKDKVMCGAGPAGVQRRTLTDDDKAGIQWIYGKKRAPGQPFRISATEAAQDYPAISGNLVVWADYRNDDLDIYGYNLDTRRTFPICADPGPQWWPDVSGDVAIWMDYTTGSLYGYDISEKHKFLIRRGIGDLRHVAIDGNMVVWVEQDDAGDFDLYGYDVATKTVFPISDSHAATTMYDVSGDTVVWCDTRLGDYDIFGYDMSTGTEFDICLDSGDQMDVTASGDTVVWHDWRDDVIYAYNLAEGTRTAVGYAHAPLFGLAISGDRVVWEDDFDIFGHDLSTGTTFTVCATADSQLGPDISGDYVVWSDERGLYGMLLP